MKVMIYVGLDVHNESIAVSIAPSDSIEVRRWGVIGGTHEHVQRFIKQLTAAHPEATLKFCYEAGPRGYPLCRFLRGLGQECLIVCPSRVPRAPGDRQDIMGAPVCGAARIGAGERDSVYEKGSGALRARETSER